MQFRKQKKDITLFILIGFLVYELKVFAELIYHPLQRIFAVIGLAMIFFSPFVFKIKVANPLKENIKIVYTIFLFWIIMIILRPFITFQSYNLLSIDPYFQYALTSHLLPLVVLVDMKFNSISLIFKVVSAFAVIGLVYFIVNYNNMITVVASGIIMGGDGEIEIFQLADNYSLWFAPSSFLLLLFEFLPKKLKWLTIISNVFMLILFLFFARRSGVFFYLLYFMGMFYLYIIRSEGSKKINTIFLILLIIMVSIYIFSSYSDTLFSLLFDRLYDDSRSGVDIAAIEYINRENAWIIGNGVDAAYPVSVFKSPRYVHETGYIYMIMKGGIIYLGLYVILLLHAFYKGFFRTNNRFTKGMALYALFHVIFLIPYGLPEFGLEYLLVWISFALCENYKLRSLTNEQLNHYLRINNTL